jgi:hypothetical protein
MRYDHWQHNWLIRLGFVTIVVTNQPDDDGRKTLGVKLVIGR